MRRILIADDDGAMRSLVAATLEGPDFEIVQAVNGQEALKLAISQPPDAIILDWQMPGMTGAQVLQELRQRTDTGNIPVVMLTGRDHERAEALKLGVSAYLMKPFSPLLLLECVKAALASSRKKSARANASARERK
jgi:two-component system, OmpR family, phosphate regulon response regulator PhoB